MSVSLYSSLQMQGYFQVKQHLDRHIWPTFSQATRWLFYEKSKQENGRKISIADIYDI